MTPPALAKSIAEAEKVWLEVEKRIKPAVLEIAVRGDSGPLVVHFGSGQYKEATATRKL
ncbi:MAG: hypothetical protein KGL39_25765 [Patescibacteria group bacterium]|nr:hypothetical protein [Patescibacteria group bacterium]